MEPYKGLVPLSVYRFPNGETVEEEDLHGDNHIETPLDDLDNMEKAFVTFFIEIGDAREAARLAHYSKDIQLCSSILLNKPRIRKAIKVMRASRRESSRELIEIGANMGIQTLIQILMDPDTPVQNKLQASVMLAGKSGITPGKDMQDDLTDDKALEKISADKTNMAFEEQEAARNTVVEIKSLAKQR